MSLRPTVVATALFALSPIVATVQAQSLNMPTPRESCFVEGQHPRISLTIAPADNVKVARIFFHSALGMEFYYVQMSRVGDSFVGILPKPTFGAGPVTYYAEAFDQAYAQFPSARIEAKVVKSADTCEPGTLAPAETAATDVAVFGGSGAPAGFTGFVGAAAGPATAAGGGGLGSFLTSTSGIATISAVVLTGAVATVILMKDDERPASPSR